MVLIASRDSRFAERHQYLSIRAELADDMPRLYPRFPSCCHRVFRCRVGDPHIARAVHMHPVRPYEHLSTKALDYVSLRIELVNRVVRFEFTVGIHTIETEPPAPCGRHGAGLVTSDKGPNTLAVNVNVNRGRRPHVLPAWKLCPLTSRNARATSIRQSPDGAIRIVGGSLSKWHQTGGEKHHHAPQRYPANCTCLRHDTPLFRRLLYNAQASAARKLSFGLLPLLYVFDSH